MSAGRHVHVEFNVFRRYRRDDFGLEYDSLFHSFRFVTLFSRFINDIFRSVHLLLLMRKSGQTIYLFMPI